MKSAARAYLLASAVLFGGGLASPALAQPAPAANAAQPNANPDQTNQEAIVVTAQKRAQVLIDVPQSVTVVGGAALERNQATNFQDYLKLVPGLQLAQSNPGEGRLVIRGLNTQGVASTVAVYVDETPFGSSTGLVNGAVLAGDFDTFDVNRIEVLRGPQGTLYGANSLGGLLKFVTNEPNTRAFVVRGRVGLEATKGGDLSTRAQAVINVPISNTIAFRASGSYRFDGGFIDSVGPYKFQTEPVPVKSRSANPRVRASPPDSTVKSVGHCQPVSNRSCHIDGVACITLAWDVLSRAISLVASLLSSEFARTSLAPVINGEKSSSAAISKEIVVMASQRYCGVRSICLATAFRQLTTERCSI